MRLPTHREQYHVIGFYKVLVRVFSFYSTDGACGKYKIVSQILHLILRIGFHRHGLLASIVAKIFTGL
jgi:hypothetical protein